MMADVSGAFAILNGWIRPPSTPTVNTIVGLTLLGLLPNETLRAQSSAIGISYQAPAHAY
jgi:hypothetical protein